MPKALTRAKRRCMAPVVVMPEINSRRSHVTGILLGRRGVASKARDLLYHVIHPSKLEVGPLITREMTMSRTAEGIACSAANVAAHGLVSP